MKTLKLYTYLSVAIICGSIAAYYAINHYITQIGIIDLLYIMSGFCAITAVALGICGGLGSLYTLVRKPQIEE